MIHAAMLVRSPIGADVSRRYSESETVSRRGTPAMPFNVGPMELVIVLVIALIVLGPKRLPEAGRSIGNGMREFKDSLAGNSRDDDDDDEYAPIERSSTKS